MAIEIKASETKIIELLLTLPVNKKINVMVVYDVSELERKPNGITKDSICYHNPDIIFYDGLLKIRPITSEYHDEVIRDIKEHLNHNKRRYFKEEHIAEYEEKGYPYRFFKTNVFYDYE